MSTTEPEFDTAAIEELNRKALANQFFTPDNIYVDLSLFKDFSLGAIMRDLVVVRSDEAAFTAFQTYLLEKIKAYQTRLFHSVEPHFNAFGYSDAVVDKILADPTTHDELFLLAPNTQFIYYLIRQQVKNENHSKPANKYIKQTVSKKGDYVVKPIDISIRISTFPLVLSEVVLQKTAKIFAETLGANIKFFSKDPALFDDQDWHEWMKDTDCFYLDRFDRFGESPMFVHRQEEMEFVGTYFFVRKRMARDVRKLVKPAEFDAEVSRFSSQMDIFCDFAWIQNNETRLTEEREHVPMEDDPVEPDTAS